MSDYGKGATLAAATVLPATTATGLMLVGNANSVIVLGLVVVSLASLIMTVGMVSRYVINKKRLSE